MAATLSSVVWVIGIVVLAVVAVLVVMMLRRRSGVGATTSDTIEATAPPAAVPMTGLESALAQVTDRTGRPIRDHIEAETQHVDNLRVPDDTGPLLRRALDHVEQHGPSAADAAAGDTD